MKDLLCLDLETYEFSPGNMAPKPVVCSWALPDGQNGLLPMWEQTSWDLVEDWIDEAIAGRAVLSGHHCSYDFACLFAHAKDPLRLGRKIFAAYEADGIQDPILRRLYKASRARSA